MFNDTSPPLASILFPILSLDCHVDYEWILDSSCSHHMYPQRFVHTYEKISGGSVLMGNNAVCRMVGIDTMQIKYHDNVVRTLINVRHVPDLEKKSYFIEEFRFHWVHVHKWR